MTSTRQTSKNAAEADGALTVEQAAVLHDLLEGMSVSAAASRHGVSRSTIHRWMKSDSGFVAEMNRMRRLFVEEHRNKLFPLLEAALEAVKDGVDRGDAKLALAVLQRAGVLSMDVDNAPVTADSVEFAAHAKDLERRARIARLMND